MSGLYRSFPYTFTPKDLQNCIEINENLITTVLLTNEEILNSVTKERRRGIWQCHTTKYSIQQALGAVQLLKKKNLFYVENPNLFQDMEKILRKIKNKVLVE